MSQPSRRRRFYPASAPQKQSPESIEKGRTLILHKPYKVLSSFIDPENSHATLSEYVDVPGVDTAGRLDFESEGLLLLTSDGRLAHRITHPRYKLPKVYLVQVENIPSETALNQLRQGVLVQGEQTRPAQVELLPTAPSVPPRSESIHFCPNIPTAWLKITLREGRKRQIRKMTATVGCPTLRLIRIAIGPLVLGDLAPGQWRDLTESELELLWDQLS